MSILKELLQIAEAQQLDEGKKPGKKPGKPGDGRHDDGTDLQFTKDRPYMKKPKYPQYVPGNMWFNMTKSGPRAGDLE